MEKSSFLEILSNMMKKIRIDSKIPMLLKYEDNAKKALIKMPFLYYSISKGKY